MEKYYGLRNTPASRANVIIRPTSCVMPRYPRIWVGLSTRPPDDVKTLFFNVGVGGSKNTKHISGSCV